MQGIKHILKQNADNVDQTDDNGRLSSYIPEAK